MDVPDGAMDVPLWLCFSVCNLQSRLTLTVNMNLEHVISKQNGISTTRAAKTTKIDENYSTSMDKPTISPKISTKEKPLFKIR